MQHNQQPQWQQQQFAPSPEHRAQGELSLLIDRDYIRMHGGNHIHNNPSAQLEELDRPQPSQPQPQRVIDIDEQRAVKRATLAQTIPAIQAVPKPPIQSSQKPASQATSKRARGLHNPFRKRVPLLLQMSQVECGAACLAMLLCYYGRRSSISEISEQAGIGRDGLSALDIVKSARTYGLRVRAITRESSELRGVTLPAIVHWQFNHFLIVERWSTISVDVVDPAAGRRRISSKEFDQNFTGVVIMMEPGEQFVRHANKAQMTLASYAGQYARRAPWILLQILLASLCLQVFGLAIPLLTALIVDRLVPENQLSILPVLGLGLILVVAAQLITSLLRSLLLVYLQTRLDLQMLPAFFEHLLSLPHSFFLKRSSGDIMARISSNTVIRDIISSQLVSTVLDGSIVLVYLVILLTQAPTFGLVVLAIGFLQLLLLLFSNQRMHALAKSELEAVGKTQGYVGEILNGMEPLKASGGEQRAFDHWSNLFTEQLNVSVRRNYLSSTIATLMGTLQMLAPLLLLWYGTTLVIHNTLSLGTMLALNTLAASFLTPLASLVSSGQQLQLVQSHFERIADVLDAHPEQNVQLVQQPPRLQGRISLDNVSFRYDTNSPIILTGITVDIQPGQKIAIVGRTGSGKSTLGKLLLGLYLPTTGSIAYDGIPLRYLNYQAVRAQFGVVMQDVGIFSGSIRQNITFNAPELDVTGTVNAARLADLHDDIARMPMGYETYVSEGGGALSGGQRQRLAIARALAHHPALLLMDEATSALDVMTERRIEQNLRQLPCTQILIAHRLSTIRDADRILVLDEGMLVEQGRHEDLLRQNGYYAHLIQHQLASGDIRQ
ncbi:NHLP family bacteriocin export ABC transporter peptidase/permease/ATPase [Ktedonobacteria bacterium brp13]|nr:NHLP family bacteriocin export ABC transporter peptidase/permease/ATPase [Ktedonobacteria bacterium brp13]